MLDFTIITLTILCADLGQGKDSTKEYEKKNDVMEWKYLWWDDELW